MSDGRHVTEEDVLTVLADGPPGEPFGTREVADALGCPRRTAFGRLDRLAEAGRLRTKTVGGNVRVWWLPADADEYRPAAGVTSDAEDANALDDADERDADSAEGPDADADDAVDTDADDTIDTDPHDSHDFPDLTDEHVLTLEFRSAALGEAFLSVSSDIEMCLDGTVDLDDGTVLQYLTVSGAPPRDVFEMLQEVPQVIDLRLVARHGDEFRIEEHSAPDSLGKLFSAHGGTMRTASLEDGELVVVAAVPPTADVAGIAESAATVHPDIELTAVRLDLTPRLFRTVVEEALTDRQWTALAVAYYGGYFERPRESTGDDLAARLGITRQTFHHHLRNVQRTVFGTLLDGIDGVDDLGRAP